MFFLLKDLYGPYEIIKWLRDALEVLVSLHWCKKHFLDFFWPWHNALSESSMYNSGGPGQKPQIKEPNFLIY